MSYPVLGPYISQDRSFKIQINTADASNGQITGVYEAVSSPQGTFEAQGAIGNYSWVANAQGQSGQPPFCIRFVGSVRPSGFPYCIVDSWNGAYLTNNTMQLAGTRAYVDNKGTVQVTSLGIQIFTM